jgi:hypothetical protein
VIEISLSARLEIPRLAALARNDTVEIPRLATLARNDTVEIPRLAALARNDDTLFLDRLDVTSRYATALSA